MTERNIERAERIANRIDGYPDDKPSENRVTREDMDQTEVCDAMTDCMHLCEHLGEESGDESTIVINNVTCTVPAVVAENIATALLNYTGEREEV